MPVNKNQADRMDIIDQLLGGLTYLSISEITRNINDYLKDNDKEPVTTRTIRNDLDYIRKSFRNVHIIESKHKFRYENHYSSIRGTYLNKEHKEIILLAKNAFKVYGGALQEKYNSVIQRVLESDIINKIRTEDLSDYIQIGDFDENNGSKWLEEIYHSITNKICLDISYKQLGQEPKIRQLSPYLLKEYRNQWYMLAFPSGTINGKTNVYRLSRIQKIEPSIQKYEEDIAFSKGHYFKHSLGVFHKHGKDPIKVELKFSKDLALFILENKIHPTMEELNQDPDEFTVSFLVYDTLELKTLILGYGSNVEVLSPIELREEIKEEILKTSQLYLKG